MLKSACFSTVVWKFILSKLASMFDPILVPTCIHFPSKNQPKMHQLCVLEGIIFLIDCCIDFLSIFIRCGSPTWGYVGPLDMPKTHPRRFQDASKRAPKTKCATFFAPALILVDLGPISQIFWCNFLIDFCIDFY